MEMQPFDIAREAEYKLQPQKKVEASLDFSQKLILDSTTKSNRKRWSWTPLNLRRLEDVLSVFDELNDYWPITERQAFYRLISSKAVNKDHWYRFGDSGRERVEIYQTLGRLLKWMRIEEVLPWEALVDETRVLTQKAGYTSAIDFILSELNSLLRGYSRCLANDQKNHIEVWIEKQALLRLVEPVADKYCRRVLCCRGYNSISFQADFYHRMEEAKSHGKQPIVLYLGDWDPSGLNMIYSAMQTLEDELGLTGVDYYRCGINPEHFGSIEADPVPIKPTDSRAKKFIKLHGPTCYELDAFHPLELQKLVEYHIQRFTDMDAVACNYKQESIDIELIESLRSKITEFILRFLSKWRTLS